MDSKPTHRLDQGVYDKGQHVKRVHQPGSIPRMPIGVASINQTRRTQRIEMNGDHAENGSERHLGDLQVNGSKMEDNRSYSINSFTNPKIRQTVNEVQMHKNFDNGGEIGYDDVGKGDVKDHEEYEDNTNRAEANFHHPSTQSYESGYRNNQYAGMKSHQRPMDEDEEEEDDILQPSLGPSGTFGKPRGQVHIDDSNDGFKLPSQQSLTKDRIKKLLTESSKNSNQTNLVIGGPASTVIKHTSAGSQKKIGSSTKRSISQSKKSSMINGTPVIGVNLSSTRKRSSVSSSKNTSNIKIKDERSLKPKNSGLVMKQKDFGALPNSSPQVNDIYNHLKHKEEEPTTTTRNGQIGIHQGKRFFQPSDQFDQRATAEFGISATRKDAKASHRSNHISSAANDDYDSNNQDARSEMRESKGYYEIEMQRLKKKRETSSAKSTRSARTSKSAASKIGAQIINLNRPDM